MATNRWLNCGVAPILLCKINAVCLRNFLSA